MVIQVAADKLLKVREGFKKIVDQSQYERMRRFESFGKFRGAAEKIRIGAVAPIPRMPGRHLRDFCFNRPEGIEYTLLHVDDVREETAVGE